MKMKVAYQCSPSRVVEDQSSVDGETGLAVLFVLSVVRCRALLEVCFFFFHFSLTVCGLVCFSVWYSELYSEFLDWICTAWPCFFGTYEDSIRYCGGLKWLAGCLAR